MLKKKVKKGLHFFTNLNSAWNKIEAQFVEAKTLKFQEIFLKIFRFSLKKTLKWTIKKLLWAIGFQQKKISYKNMS